MNQTKLEKPTSTKKGKKLAKYLRGTADSLKLLANEIEKEGFAKDKEELLSKIGASLLFEAKAFDFRT